MQFLVQDLIDVMKVMKGKLEQINDYYNINNCCTEIIQLFNIQIKNADLFINLQINEAAPTEILSDKQKY